MLNYAICEIGGIQYKVVPNIPFDVSYRGERDSDIEANVLLFVSDGKIQIGKPYLKEKLHLKFLKNTLGKKIRVSKYHAKANYRRTTGIRPRYTSIILSVKN